jgi:hypothetical protein
MTSARLIRRLVPLLDRHHQRTVAASAPASRAAKEYLATLDDAKPKLNKAVVCASAAPVPNFDLSP